MTSAADWDDKPLPEDERIKAAHPTRTGRHDLYAEAMRLVGARHSKGGLVELVNWLLARIDDLEDTLDGIPECECADCNAAVEAMQRTPRAKER